MQQTEAYFHPFALISLIHYECSEAEHMLFPQVTDSTFTGCLFNGRISFNLAVTINQTLDSAGIWKTAHIQRFTSLHKVKKFKKLCLFSDEYLMRCMHLLKFCSLLLIITV